MERDARCTHRLEPPSPALSLFALIVPALADGTLDQEYDPTTANIDLWSPVSSTVHTAQTFTVGISGWLDCVEVYCIGDPGARAELILDVRETRGGAPIDADLPLAQVSIPTSSLPVFWDFYTVDLSSFRLAVRAGETLAIVLRSEIPETHILAAIAGSAAEHYPPGTFFTRGFPELPTWTALFTSADKGFRTYVTPFVRGAFCPGDGSGAACPCDNESKGGGGCANGTFDGGGVLDAVGEASVTSGAVELQASALAPNQPALFFQGDERVAGGDGQPFGDGLRCVGTNVVRLEIRFADSGGAASTTVDLVEEGGVSAGDFVRYQCWYRDPAGSPCGSGFNLTNGFELEWGP